MYILAHLEFDDLAKFRAAYVLVVFLYFCRLFNLAIAMAVPVLVLVLVTRQLRVGGGVVRCAFEIWSLVPQINNAFKSLASGYSYISVCPLGCCVSVY